MNKDTIRLLEQCDAGVKMAVASIDDVLGRVKTPALREHLERSRELHRDLGREMTGLLCRIGHEPPEPSAMARSMAKMKTGVKLTLRPADSTVAVLMTDGCNMGIQSLSRYLNRHPAADVQSREMARRLIGIEDRMANGLRAYL